MEKIMTLHPQGKKGVHISMEKYSTIKEYILTYLRQNGTSIYQDLSDNAVRDLSKTFEGNVTWYIVSVKLDLEARNMIRRVPKTSPHQIELNG